MENALCAYPDYEDLLRQRGRELTSEVQTQCQQPFDASPANSSGGRGDEGDEAAAAVAADIRVLELQRDVRELTAIAAALRRIADGTYGTCVECGEDIEPLRLRAQPTATHCVDCQVRREHTFWHPPRSSL